MRALAVTVENDSLKVAQRLALAPAFIRELRAFERTIGACGHTGFEGKGEHDDLVIAAALVCWATRADLHTSKTVEVIPTWYPKISRT